jgi:hypothetical protein
MRNLPLLRPSDFGSTRQCESLDIEHPSLRRNSFWIGKISWTSSPEGFFGLDSALADVLELLPYQSSKPFAKSSSISKSFSFADMDRYKVVIE